MIDVERMYKYMELLERKLFITSSEFMTLMEISHATFKRDLAVLRDRFDVPILYDRDVGAYKLDQTYNKKRLPGIWFSPEEIRTIRQLCDELSENSSPHIATDFQSLNSKLSKIVGL
jgi:predicted DNA-binding transcriptional regulator YafY